MTLRNRLGSFHDKIRAVGLNAKHKKITSKLTPNDDSRHVQPINLGTLNFLPKNAYLGPVYTTVEKSTSHEKKGISQL